MKMRVSEVRSKYPFLNKLIDETGWSKGKFCKVDFRIDEPLDISAPFHDGCVRYTSSGIIKDGRLEVKSHYAGCYDTILCNPQEVGGIGMDNKMVKENCFYAYADSFEYWRVRHIVVYIRSEKVDVISNPVKLIEVA